MNIKQNLTTVNYNSMSGKINKYIVIQVTPQTRRIIIQNILSLLIEMLPPIIL